MIIVYPTETCYGIGCSAYDKESIKKIYKLKKRRSSKPLIVLVDSIKMWKKIAKVNKKALELAKKYWPCPLTIVTKKKKIIPDILTKEFIGVRISPHPIPNKLIKELKAPLVSTSANLSNGKNPYSLRSIPKEIRNKVDRLIDRGKLPRCPPSTVVKVDNNKIFVLRKGSIKL